VRFNSDARERNAGQICERPDVKKELQRATKAQIDRKKIKAGTSDKFWFVTHGLLLLGCAILSYLLGLKVSPLSHTHIDLSRRLIHGAALIIIVLAAAKAIRVYAIGRIDDTAIRFTLRRILLLVVGALIVVITVSVVFVNWYGALTALGVGSIIIGLAVQTPAKSFIAWIYILIPAAVPSWRSNQNW
jgi:small-conductance mechanosensitive channel